MNARLHLLFGVLAIAVTLPWSGPLSASALEGEIAHHMNAGSSAPVTDRVSCVRRAAENVRYTCSLHGRSAEPLRVRVDVDRNTWRAYWPPVQG